MAARGSARYPSAMDADLNARLDHMMATIAGHFEALSVRMDERMDRLEERMGRLEERMGRLEERMDRLDERMDALAGRMDALERRVDAMGFARPE
jgi:predicted nuclease with TOPRIM domain